MIKMAAHSGDASTLDWHPVKPYILATGGASDRSVKVWDLEKELSILHHNHNAPTHSSSREDIAHQLERNSSTGTSRGESVGTNESSTVAGNDTASG
jgi:WD40 repeat protein